jgi:hypothetical protein
MKNILLITMLSLLTFGCYKDCKEQCEIETAKQMAFCNKDEDCLNRAKKYREICKLQCSGVPVSTLDELKTDLPVYEPTTEETIPTTTR